MEPLRENLSLRWRATPRFWRIVLFTAMMGCVCALAIRPLTYPPPFLAAVRTLLVLAALAAITVNKLVADDFYVRVYMQASVIAIVLSAIVFVACTQYAFAVPFSATSAVAILVISWWIGFIVAFLRLSRA